MVDRSPFPAVPEPMLDLASHHETITALKMAVDTLTRHRMLKLTEFGAVTWADLVSLGLITRDQIPKR